MSMFKKKAVFKRAAVASAVVAALSVTSAQAVNLAEDGLGEAFVIPYYTANNNFNTYLHITNTSGETTTAKIRFREGYNSREVRDFNIVLSPYDVWTGVITKDDTTGGGKLITYDTTCTVPAIIAATSPANPGSTLFTPAEYDGSGDIKQDGGPDGFARTLEGYVEIFSMGRDGTVTDTANSFAALSDNAKHEDKAGGYRAPVDCATVEAQFSAANIANTKAEMDEPTNSLQVTAQVLNVMDGTGYGVNAVTFANFYNPTNVDGASAGDIIAAPGSLSPDFSDVSPAVSEIHDDVVGTQTLSVWNGQPRILAIDALLMRNTLINRFRAAAGQADTDWVITFPTKWAHVDQDADGSSDLATVAGLDPFVELYTQDETVNGGESKVQVGINTYDREEDAYQSTNSCTDPFTHETFPISDPSLCPSPTIPTSPTNAYLKYEVNVIEFGDGIFGSQLADATLNSQVNQAGFSEGWTRLDLTVDSGSLVSDNAHAYAGLPVVGTSFLRLDNGVSGIEIKRYGFSFDHAYTRAVLTSGN
jgi:hypothetical protein